MGEIVSWCSRNGLVLNHRKTNVLQFYNTKRPNYSPVVKINGSSLEMNHVTKYLGLTIIENLNLRQDVGYITKRLLVVCCLVNRLQYVVDRKVLLTI